MSEMSGRKGPASPLEAMPAWMRDLKGFDELRFKRRVEGGDSSFAPPAPESQPLSESGSIGETWRLAIVMPADVEEAAERVDPILFLPGLAGAIDELEARIAEIVRHCRAKQAAWQRFSGEE